MEKSNNYNYFIDILKFIFSIIIVIYHGWHFEEYYGTGYFEYGNLAVGFFFIVTGYLMMNSLEKEQNNNLSTSNSTFIFIKKKMFTIIPYVLVAFIIGSILLYKVGFLTKDIILSNQYIMEIFQLGILGSGFVINRAAWYISAMLVVLVALYPLAKKFGKKYLFEIVPILLLILSLLTFSFGINCKDPLGVSWIFLNGLWKGFIYILIGNLTFLLANKIKSISFSKIGLVFITTIELLLYVLTIVTMQYNFFGTVIVAIFFTVAISLTFSNKSYTFKIFKSTKWKKLGKLSLIIYLNNSYLITFMLAGNYIYGYKNTMLIYFTAVIIISLVSYLIIPIITKILKNSSYKFKKILLNN